MSTITTTIEIEGCEIEVEITYEAVPGERRTWDYPGSPPYAELGRVKSRANCIPHEMAYKHVEDHWDRFQDMCLEDAALRDEAARDAAEEEKFERRRLGE
jgi:hypothetical protein